MSQERKQILQMLAQGKVTSEEAEQLLDKLGSGPSAVASGPLAGAAGVAAPGAMPKFMRIHVDSVEGDKVDIRLPVGLLRSGIKLSAMMPKEAAAAMSKNGFDFAQLGGLVGDDLIASLSAMSIDVASADGEKVRIFCE